MGITQTLSDEGQRNTIAFDGLAFLTGSLGADSFFPPGKVADFWGFSTCATTIPARWDTTHSFLTSAAFNMWGILTHQPARRSRKDLANRQVTSIDDFA